MDWEIETGVPIPPKGSPGKTSGAAAFFKKMEVGQSVHITQSTRESIAGSYSRVANHWGYRFVSRSTNDGLRVWRVG